jgi:large conductance mechanosensitive channel
MLKEFREFAVKGNVVDMAVGIVIGAAFTSIVKAFVDHVIMPPLGLVTGGLDFTNQFLVLKPGSAPGPYLTLEQAKGAGAVVLGYGMLLNAMLSFLIVAMALFFVVRWINRLKGPAPAPAAPSDRPCPYCTLQIPLAAKRCPHCTSQIGAAA